MHVSPALPRPTSPVTSLAKNALLALSAAIVVLILGAGTLMGLVRLVYADRALPGVRVAGLEVGGRSQAEIELGLGDTLTYPSSGLVVLHYGGQIWSATPSELGVVIDAPAMAEEALSVGRRGSLFTMLGEQAQSWFRGIEIAPKAILDQRVGAAYLQSIARSIDRPAMEASVSVNGLQIEMVPGQIGLLLDVPATLESLSPALIRFHDAEVALVVVETPPLVLDASQVAETAKRILSAPLVLTAEGAGPWTFEPSELAAMMRFDMLNEDSGAFFQISFNLQSVMDLLEPLAEDLELEPQNARFIFNDDTRQLDLLQPAVIGRSLDLPATQDAIREGLIAGEHEIPLAFQIENPAVTDDATSESLGITEAVSVVSTYFSGSSSSRIKNIKIASGAFHGLLVAPGETLSMAEVLGEISLDKGYSEAWIIYGNRTIKGVGGGVCQVSTTLFRAAFFGGFGIVERHPHAYRVSYYEKGPNSPGPGLDATVYIPIVDFKFTNDTPNWLLLETYVYNNRQLQWKFYSTSDGRQVNWHSSGPTDIVEAPDPLYRENPALATGVIKQVDWAADGMYVRVDRTVTRGGETLHSDTFKTRYKPWQAVYEYGPGTELPPGALPDGEGEPSEPAPEET